MTKAPPIAPPTRVLALTGENDIAADAERMAGWARFCADPATQFAQVRWWMDAWLVFARGGQGDDPMMVCTNPANQNNTKVNSIPLRPTPMHKPTGGRRRRLALLHQGQAGAGDQDAGGRRGAGQARAGGEDIGG